MKPDNHRNARIDVVRAMAITWVLLHHYWSNAVHRFPAVTELAAANAGPGYHPFGHFIRLLEGSSLGIKLFWFVSGFCIHTAFLSWWDRRAADPARSLSAYWRGFFIVRFWRIYPPYLLALLVIFVVEYRGHLGELRSYMHLSLHLACIHNYFAAFIFNINYSFWSIAIESQRYLLYPILLLLWLRWGAARALLACMTLSLAVRFVAPELTDAFWADHNPVGFWFDWLIGATIAEHWRARKMLFRAHGTLIVVVGGTYLACFALPLPAFLCPLLQPIVYAVAFEWFIHRQSPLGRFERWIAPLGTISFSVFLLHEPIFRWGIPAFAKHLPLLPAWAVLVPGFLLALVPVVAASWIYNRLVEIPSNNCGKRLASPRLPALPKLATVA
jgi:peptidoglycan/LPS O-acetylase OafA/YrhL